jgi:DNA (cytosine-5)-methyltransferase 1
MGNELLIPQVPDGYRELASGLVIPKTVRKYPIGFDFFAGAGGFSLGFIQAGFEMLGASEWSTDAAHTYLANLGAHPVQMYYSSDAHRDRMAQYFDKYYKNWQKANKDNPTATFPVSGHAWRQSELNAGNYYPGVKNFFFGDICEYDGKEMCRLMGIEVGELDVVIGGPPCQGFSTLNSKTREKKATDPRNNLVFQYARMLVEMYPKSFVMENVPEILEMRTSQGVPVIDQFLRIIEDGNYMSYEAGMRALNIREKDIGKKPKYVVVPKRNATQIKQENEEEKNPAPKTSEGIIKQIARATGLKYADYKDFLERTVARYQKQNNIETLTQAEIKKLIRKIQEP